MGKDLIASPYGRFFHLPRILAERGHEVTIALLDYENGAKLEVDAHGIRWTSTPFRGYLAALRRRIAQSPVDCVIGFSDTYFGILAVRLARQHGTRACIDAYDNYESYMPWAKPLHWLWRRALRRADQVTAAGPNLLALMLNGQQVDRGTVVPMAADPTGFEPRDKKACRETLQLPIDGPLVGYCGSMHRSRGVEVLFDAIPLVLAKRPDVGFIHSGRTWSDVSLPETIQSLGFIEDEKVPVLLNCMDALVVTNRESSFGHYSYPVKLYEAMSCNIPVIATRTRATEWILGDSPGSLVKPGDARELCDAILLALDKPDPDYGLVPTWNTGCDVFEKVLRDIGKN